MEITKRQIIKVHTLLNKEIEEHLKCDVVNIYTDGQYTSVKDLTFDQANRIIVDYGGQPEEKDIVLEHLKFGKLRRDNPQHRRIMAVLYQLNWTMKSRNMDKMILDVERFGEFVKTHSKAKKPVTQMTPSQCSNLIYQLESILTKKF